MSALPTPERTRLGEIAADLGRVQCAAWVRKLALPWELDFLRDVAEADARKDAWAYQMSFEGELGCLVVDHHPGGGHLLSMESTAEFIRLRLVKFHWPDCDGSCSCGFDDDDDDDWDWPRSSPRQCECADVEPGISLSEIGRAVLAGAAG